MGAAAGAAGAGKAAPMIGWDILALTYCGWVWGTVWRIDAETTASHATREEPSRDQADLVLLGAAVASLAAVGAECSARAAPPGNLKYIEAGLALVSVFVSWTLVHTVFTLKYARLYCSDMPGGIDFNGSGHPDYPDFAYLAFTIGMTFQVLTPTSDQADPADGTAPRVAVVPARRGDDRRVHQPGVGPGQVTQSPNALQSGRSLSSGTVGRSQRGGVPGMRATGAK